MKLLLLVDPSFWPAEAAKKAEARAWIESLRGELEKLGISAALFSPLTHAVKDFEIALVFSREEPETWTYLRQVGLRVWIFPYADFLGEAPLARSPLQNVIQAALTRALGFALTWARARRGAGMRSKNPTSALSAGEIYLVCTSATERWLSQNWSIPRARIRRMPAQAPHVARTLTALAKNARLTKDAQ